MTKLIFGTGDYRYEVVQPFGVLPPGMEFGITYRVAVDSKDRVYVTHQGSPPVLVFDGDGRFLAGWGEDVLADPHGIYITHNDEVFITDRDAHQVLKFTVDGEHIFGIGSRGRASFQAPFNHPANVAVSANGEIYVADGYGNSCVHRFSAEGRLLHSWGIPGNRPGEFSTPHGIWIDEGNKVYVADRENNRVQVFDAEGHYVTEWRDLYHPMDIWSDGDGAFVVTDQVPRFTVLDSQGKVLSRGKAPDAGLGVSGDSKGNLYLAGTFPGAAPTSQGIVKLVKQ